MFDRLTGLNDLVIMSILLVCLLVLLLAWILYYLWWVVQKPLLIVGNDKWRSYLVQAAPCLTEPYWPTFWCAQTHLNTAFGILIRGLKLKLKFARESIPTTDGAKISLDWYDPTGQGDLVVEQEPNQPILLFLPGITGHSHAEYLKSLVPLAARVGYRVCVLNYRGLDGNPIITPRLYCAATDEDLKTALGHIRARVGSKTQLIAVGISMGGAVLAGYLASAGSASSVDAAFLISTCWDFIAGSYNLEEGLLNRQLNAYLTQGLIDVVLSHRQILERELPGLFDFDEITKCRTLRTFDNAFTRKMFGFRDCDEYYERSTHKDDIGQIRVPTLAINASDDMILPEKDLPLAQVAASSHVAMLVPSRGGHIGFLDQLLPTPWSKFYLERVMEQYLVALYGTKENVQDLLA